MKERFNVQITMIGSGKTLIYNMYMPQNKHASRRRQYIEQVFAEQSQEKVQAGRNYLVLELSGECLKDKCDIQMPLVKYKLSLGSGR